MAKSILIKNGIVENVVIPGPNWNPPEDVECVNVDDSFVVGLGWIYQNGEFIPPEPPSNPPSSNQSSRILTKYQFRRRFTLDELIKFDNPELFIPNMTPQQKAIAHTLLRSFDAATEIDLTDDQLQYGINLMVQWGLLTPERAQEILSIG